MVFVESFMSMYKYDGVAVQKTLLVVDHENELSSWFQYPRDVVHHPIDLGDVMDHAKGIDAVEAGVPEWKTTSVGADHTGLQPGLPEKVPCTLRAGRGEVEAHYVCAVPRELCGVYARA